MGGSCLFWKKDHAEFCRLGTNSAITAKSSTVLALFLPQRRKPRKCASRFSVHVAPKKAAAFLDTRRRPSPSTSRRFLQRKEPDCSDCETSRFFEDEGRRRARGRTSVFGFSAACGARGRRAGGRLVRSYSGDSSKADGDTPNKQPLRDSEGARMRRKGGEPLNQRSKQTIQEPAAEGDTVA